MANSESFFTCIISEIFFNGFDSEDSAGMVIDMMHRSTRSSLMKICSVFAVSSCTREFHLETHLPHASLVSFVSPSVNF